MDKEITKVRRHSQSEEKKADCFCEYVVFPRYTPLCVCEITVVGSGASSGLTFACKSWCERGSFGEA